MKSRNSQIDRGVFSNIKRLISKKFILAVLVVVAAVATVIWVIGTREEWGPELATDPNYRSGRASFCKPLSSGGQILPSEVQNLGIAPRGRGVERSIVHTFDASRFTGGEIDVCSEYGFVRLEGTSGTEGRVEITVIDPFPGGDRAVDDTRFVSELRVIDGKLHIGVAQLTQGVTSYRSYFSKGSRPAAVNVIVQIPRSGTYNVNLTANHQRIGIYNLDISGSLAGYASPGADIEASLDGSLTVKLSGVSYEGKWSGDDGLQGGTNARLRPLRSGSVELTADEGDIRLDIVGDEAGLDVTTNDSPGSRIQIGPTVPSDAEPGKTHARSTGFAAAPIEIQVFASSSKGLVIIQRVSR